MSVPDFSVIRKLIEGVARLAPSERPPGSWDVTILGDGTRLIYVSSRFIAVSLNMTQRQARDAIYHYESMGLLATLPKKKPTMARVVEDDLKSIPNRDKSPSESLRERASQYMKDEGHALDVAALFLGIPESELSAIVDEDPPRYLNAIGLRLRAERGQPIDPAPSSPSGAP